MIPQTASLTSGGESLMRLGDSFTHVNESVFQVSESFTRVSVPWGT
jgi:3-methyladenine DNA glycosylase AlkC